MSMAYFLGTEQSLTKTEYGYKYILPRISEGDMMYKCGISFDENLREGEAATGVRKILKGCHIYAIRATFGIDYEARYRQTFSPREAANMFDALAWLKGFIIKQLARSSRVYIAALWQDREFAPKEVKRIEVDAERWELSEDGDYIFGCGTVHEFFRRNGAEAT